MSMKRARTEEAKEDRRAAVLKAALDEFFIKGFTAARMDDIARRADLSKGTLYLYFSSKDALFQALIEDLTTPHIQHMEQLADLAVTLEDALARLAELAPGMIRTSELPRLMKVLIADSHNFPDIVREYRRNVLDRLLGIVTRMFERLKAQGEIVVDDTHLAARLLVAPIAFSGIWHAVFEQESDAQVDLETLFRMHASNMLAALRPEVAE